MKRCIALMAVVCVSAFGQSPVAKVAADAKTDWEMIKATLVKAAAAMPEADYAFKPVATVRSYGEEVAHAADVQTMLCGMVTGSGAKPAAAKKTKAELVAALAASNTECDKAFAAITDANATEVVDMKFMKRSKLGLLEYNNGHSNETYGTMVVYLRMKGLVPPSSQR
jgi:predicted GNAT family acetyltransferase